MHRGWVCGQNQRSKRLVGIVVKINDRNGSLASGFGSHPPTNLSAPHESFSTMAWRFKINITSHEHYWQAVKGILVGKSHRSQDVPSVRQFSQRDLVLWGQMIKYPEEAGSLTTTSSGPPVPQHQSKDKWFTFTAWLGGPAPSLGRNEGAKKVSIHQHLAWKTLSSTNPLPCENCHLYMPGVKLAVDPGKSGWFTMRSSDK
ncbi:hypothetical protein DFH27DRAFT_289306 [Peziza echinospora]|nr:hypothetical protein DFH27DRAFT_289306 [Peziza echinospora]